MLCLERWAPSLSSLTPHIAVHKSFLNIIQNKYFSLSHYYWSIPLQNPNFSDNSRMKGIKELARNRKCFLIITGKKEIPGSSNAVLPHVPLININPYILLIVLTWDRKRQLLGKKVNGSPRRPVSWIKQTETERTWTFSRHSAVTSTLCGMHCLSSKCRKSQRIHCARDHFPWPQSTQSYWASKHTPPSWSHLSRAARDNLKQWFYCQPSSLHPRKKPQSFVRKVLAAVL